MSAEIETPVPQVRASNVRTVVAALKRIGTWIKGDKLAMDLGGAGGFYARMNSTEQRLRDAVGGHVVMTLAVQVGQTWGLR